MTQPPPTLTQQNTAVVFIDLQTAPLTTIGSIEQSELRANAAKLAQMAALYALPVIVAAGTQTGPGSEVIAEVAIYQSTASTVRHSTPNAQRTSAFADAIGALGRTHLILAGIAADVGVLLTALDLQSAGYTVYVAVDVTGAVTARAEAAAFDRLRHAGVIVSSWASMAAELQGDFAAPHGRELLDLFNPRLLADASPPGGQ
jgi:nicotinamidase-related amidase